MKTTLFFAFSVAALISGCGNNNNTGTDMSTGGDMNTGGGDPVKPALATTQVERMGRGTINVAVTNPFDLDYTKGIDGTTTIYGGTNRNATRDLNSKDGDFANWKTKWTPIIAKTLAIYDGVDMTCGNQFGACAKPGGCVAGDVKNPQRYDFLAGVLADDQLYVNTAVADCSYYLAVEAGVGGTFCGGRTPNVDVVDVMYTAATVGATGFPSTPGGAFAVGDAVSAEAATETKADLTNFPFLGAPNQ